MRQTKQMEPAVTLGDRFAFEHLEGAIRHLLRIHHPILDGGYLLRSASLIAVCQNVEIDSSTIGEGRRWEGRAPHSGGAEN